MVCDIKDATTLSIKTFSITTLSITTLSIASLSVATLRILIKNTTLRIYATQHQALS
jgi:hypothetical protein